MKTWVKVLLGVLIAVVLALCITVGVLATRKTEETKSEVCTTAECVALAGELLEGIDPSVDPCDDFYAFSCGGWKEKNPIPSSEGSWGAFQHLSQENQLYLRSQLEGPAPKPSDPFAESISKARDFYSACMDTDTMDSLGMQPIADLLSEVTWTATDTWGQTDWDHLAASLATITREGLSAALSLSVYSDDKNSSVAVVQLSQSGLGLPSPEYYADNSTAGQQTQQDYRAVMRDLLQIANLTGADADKIYQLEERLAANFLPADAMRDPEATYNAMDLAGLEALFPEFAWEAYLAALFPSRAKPAGLDVGRILVRTPDYFTKLHAALTAAEPKVALWYLQWRVLLAYAGDLSAEFRAASLEYKRIIAGVSAEPDRWETCVSRTDSALGFVLGKLFVDGRFAGDSRTIAASLIAKIKAAFVSGLPSEQWMSDEVRKASEEKCAAVVEKIGYPDLITSAPELTSYYADMAVAADQYCGNVRSARRWEADDMVADLDRPVDRTKWDMTPSQVNAYYNPSFNEIVFPAGIMQPPFFRAGFPWAYNLGGIGVVMGHELTHGFDDQGSQYDKEGNLSPWWPQEVRDAFNGVTKCIVDQYASYEIEGVHVNGNLTLGENIADNGGLKQSFRAWRAWAPALGDEAKQTLPALPYTPDQLFFLGFSQVWCSNSRPETVLQRLLTDPHSPHEFRVNGVCQNSPDFAEAWGCKAGSPMNPADKCVVW